MNKGILCISLDTELLWGRHFLDNWAGYKQLAGDTRPAIKKLVKLFEDKKIPATWAVVGHLFLDHCDKVNGVKHPEIIRPVYEWRKVDWFANDPSTDIRRDPEWYGKDIVELLKQTKYQEIGSHSFSHLLFGAPGVSENVAESDINLWVKTAKASGIHAVSFVYPKNLVGYPKLLAKHGFKAYRGPDPVWYQKTNPFVHRTMSIIDLFSPFSPPVSTPENKGGLVNIPGSWYFVSARGKRSYIPKGVRFNKAKLGIDRAIRENKVFHIWSHPIDFAYKTEDLIDELEQIINYAKEKQSEGKLDILSMKQISELFLNS